MITNLVNKSTSGKIEVRATALNPRWKEGTIRTIHMSIAKIWLAKGWVIETEKELYKPVQPDAEAVSEAKKKVRKPRVKK